MHYRELSLLIATDKALRPPYTGGQGKRWQILPIACIGAYPGVGLPRLAKIMGVKKPVAHRKIRRLTSLGLISRVSGGRWNAAGRYYLTARGEAIFKAIDEPLRAVCDTHNRSLLGLRGRKPRACPHCGGALVPVRNGIDGRTTEAKRLKLLQ